MHSIVHVLFAFIC